MSTRGEPTRHHIDCPRCGLAHRLRRARLLAGMSQADLAEAVDCSKTEIGRAENTRLSCRSHFFRAVGRKLGQPLSWLRGHGPEWPPGTLPEERERVTAEEERLTWRASGGRIKLAAAILHEIKHPVSLALLDELVRADERMPVAIETEKSHGSHMTRLALDLLVSQGVVKRTILAPGVRPLYQSIKGWGDECWDEIHRLRSHHRSPLPRKVRARNPALVH